MSKAHRVAEPENERYREYVQNPPSGFE